LLLVAPSARDVSTPVPEGILLPMLSKSDCSKMAKEYTIALGKWMKGFAPKKPYVLVTNVLN
jgi:hypothetical protein